MDGRPNLIVICTDQQRADSLGCLGNAGVRTPNLDRFAGTAMVLRNHYAPNPICGPSRASMYTGRYPRHHRSYTNGIVLDPSLRMLSGLLARAGYRTESVGKLHFTPVQGPRELNLPESLAFWEEPGHRDWTGPYYGFQSVQLLIGDCPEIATAGHYGKWLRDTDPRAVKLYARAHALETARDSRYDCWKLALPAELHHSRWVADRSIDCLRSAEPPFFLFISFNDPHHPYAAPRPYCDHHEPAEIRLPRIRAGELDDMPPFYREDRHPHEQGFLMREVRREGEASLRMAIAMTFGMVEMLDDNVGRILEALARLGLERSSIVVFTSDHGELLGEHDLLRKGPVSYGSIYRIPFMIRVPWLSSPRSSDALTSHVDLLPTLCELLGVDTPRDVDGRSLGPLLAGGTSAVREYLFSEYHPRAELDLYSQSVRTLDWRLTIYPHHPEWGELFDEREDSGELVNRYGDPSCRGVSRELRGVLTEEMPAQPAADSKRICLY